MIAALEGILETSPELQGYLKFDSRMGTLEQIFKALQDPNMERILVSGIAGVGKTTLVKQVAVCAAELGLFDGVVTATVVAHKQEEQTLKGVQRQLANALGLSLNDELLEHIRQRLMSGKFLVIVEDVWKLEDAVDGLLEKLGIPSGCKVLVTSRSSSSNNFASWSCVSIGVLEEQEAWRLFVETVGNDAEDQDLDGMVKKVVRRCKGMPVLIVTIAAALSKRPTPSAWEDALGQLEGMKNMELLEYVTSAVEFICYNYLPALQKSLFLLCGLLQNISGDQIAISMLRSEWSKVEGLEGGPNLDSLILDLKSSHLLLQGESSSYVKMHDLVRNAAIEIAYKALDVIQCAEGSSSSTKANKIQDGIQYWTGGSVLGHTRLLRLLGRVVPDLEMKQYTLLKELKALKRMNDLVSLASSCFLTRTINRGQWGIMKYVRSKISSEFSDLNSVRKEQLLHTSIYDNQGTMGGTQSMISIYFIQIQPVLAEFLIYLPPNMIQDLGKVPKLKALGELRTEMEATQSRTRQYKYEVIMEEEPLPELVLELAIESATCHITKRIINVDWVGISGEGRHEVVQKREKY